MRKYLSVIMQIDWHVPAIYPVKVRVKPTPAWIAKGAWAVISIDIVYRRQGVGREHIGKQQAPIWVDWPNVEFRTLDRHLSTVVLDQSRQE